MNQVELNRELLSFAEKISLAKLEESKAAQRVREIEYQRERFSLEAFMVNAREDAQKNKG